ncbi:MAG: esterase/lipase family protein [Ilumatobacteraceae bacterium]
MSAGRRGVVVVSGGGAISPFTTPTAGCASGLAAGSTDTGLREALLGAGLAVWTSPANIGHRPVRSDPDVNGFDGAPATLPAEMTVNAAGPIDTAGEHLAAFLGWLAAEEALTEVDLVCHSMGGLFSRAAMRELRDDGHPLRVRSLVTLGTPWQGSLIADVANGHRDVSLAAGDPSTEAIITDFRQLLADVSEGAGTQVTARYLSGPDGWNARQGDVLRDVPVTTIAGDWFTLPADDVDGGDPSAWPHDGLVSRASALAVDVPAEVLPEHRSHVFPDVHSIFFADQFGLPWHRALTWNPDVMKVVLDALAAA